MKRRVLISAQGTDIEMFIANPKYVDINSDEPNEEATMPV